MIGIGTKIDEREKSENIAALTYEGLVRTIWVPKKIIKKETKTIEGKKGELYYLPHTFARAHNIPQEIFILPPEDFCEVLNDVLPDIEPNLEEAIITFTQSVKLPPGALKLVECGLVPLRKGTKIYLVPKNHIIEFDPALKAWKILVNTDFMKSDSEIRNPYKSFTFVVNGEVMQWNNGEIFITTPDDEQEVVE